MESVTSKLFTLPIPGPPLEEDPELSYAEDDRIIPFSSHHDGKPFRSQSTEAYYLPSQTSFSAEGDEEDEDENEEEDEDLQINEMQTAEEKEEEEMDQEQLQGPSLSETKRPKVIPDGSSNKKSRGRPSKGDESLMSLSCRWEGCEAQFSNAKDARVHERLHGSNEEHRNGEYVCRINRCLKACANARQLRKHLLLHQPKSLVCEECGKGFHDAGKLHRHQAMHAGDKPFECDQCGKVFGLRANLKTHMRVHTGERPFPCDFPGCTKRFAQACNRNTHYQTHIKKEQMKNRKPLGDAAHGSTSSLNEPSAIPGRSISGPYVSLTPPGHSFPTSLSPVPPLFSFAPSSSSSSRPSHRNGKRDLAPVNPTTPLTAAMNAFDISLGWKASNQNSPQWPTRTTSSSATAPPQSTRMMMNPPYQPMVNSNAWPRSSSASSAAAAYTSNNRDLPAPPSSSTMNSAMMNSAMLAPPADFISRANSASSQLNLEPISHSITDFDLEVEKPAADVEDASLLLYLQGKWS